MPSTEPNRSPSQSPLSAPTFAVVIPTFNYGRYLARAIDSVLAQSRSDWELVVVDDGSTDGTSGVLAGVDDPRVRSIRQPNAGPFAAIQTAFGATCAPWLVVFDADDRLLPGALEALARAVASNPAAVAVVGPWVSIRTDGSERAEPFTLPSGEPLADFRAVLTGRLRFATGAAALARSELQRLHAWKAPVRHGVETMVFAHLMLTGRCAAVRTPLLAVHDHAGRLRDNLPSIVAAGTGLVDAVFDPAVIGPEAMRFRGEFLAFFERERGRAFYRNGCYADAAAAFARAAAADSRAVLDLRTLRRWAVSRARVAAGRPGLSAQDRADAVARRRRDIPVPPVAGGDLRSFRADAMGTVLNASRTCGDVALLRLWEPTYLIGHPDDVRHVLSTNASNYVRSRFATIRRVFGNSLIGDEGESHRNQRRIVQPFYVPRSAATSISPAVACLNRVTASWSDGQEVNVARELLRVNIGLAGATVLGIDDPAEAEELFEMVNRTLIKGVKINSCPVHIPEVVPLRRHRLYRRYGEALDARIGAIIDQRAAGADGDRDDFVAHMLKAQRLEQVPLDRQRMIDHAKTMFTAGGEPIATPTASALWRLAVHPEHEAALVEEAVAAIGGRDAAGGDTDHLPFAAAFWRETLRLHPSNWLMPRRALSSDTLPGGLKVPAGREVFISQFALHHDERYYPDAERFDPARFTEPLASTRPRDAYMPFGRGPHACIGASLAEQVGVALFATLVRDWRFEPVPGGDPVVHSPNLFISLIKDTRLMLRVRRRHSAPGPRPSGQQLANANH